MAIGRREIIFMLCGVAATCRTTRAQQTGSVALVGILAMWSPCPQLFSQAPTMWSNRIYTTSKAIVLQCICSGCGTKRNLSGSIARCGISKALGVGGLISLFLMLLAGLANGMTVDELVGQLRTAGADDTAQLLSSSPTEIRESRPDFLAGAVYLEVQVLLPYHPVFPRFVHRMDKGLYRSGSAKELDRLRTELEISIKDAEMALRFAQWRLQQTEGSGLWLVSAVDEVPFSKLPLFAEDVKSAKPAVARLLAPPSAKTVLDGFAVTQDAVLEGDLVRYQAQVGRDGAWSCSKAILVSKLAHESQAFPWASLA